MSPLVRCVCSACSARFFCQPSRVRQRCRACFLARVLPADEALRRIRASKLAYVQRRRAAAKLKGVA